MFAGSGLFGFDLAEVLLHPDAGFFQIKLSG
jgi:hypothetical protein